LFLTRSFDKINIKYKNVYSHFIFLRRGDTMTQPFNGQKKPMEFEAMPVKSVLNAVKAPSMPFDWSINPYRGCQHGCSFCYARSTHSFLGLEADDTFQRHIFLKEGAPGVLREQLRKRLRSKAGLAGMRPVAIGTATDPYQQVEARAELTRGCLEVLAEYQVPVTITTRSPLILRDLDLLKQLPVSSVNISLSTLNPTVWRQFEPYTPSPAQRLKTIRRLTEEGIPAGIFTAPILPYLTDKEDDLTELIASASAAGSQFMMPSFLRLSTSEVKVWFFQTLERHYPHLVADYAKLYSGSGSVPHSFRAPVMEAIERLLMQYPMRPFKAAAEPPFQPARPDAEPEGAGEPVQLTLF